MLTIKTIAIGIGLFVLCVVVGLAGAAAAWEFGLWCIRSLWALVGQLRRALVKALIAVTRFICVMTFKAVSSVARFAWEMTVTGVVKAVVPVLLELDAAMKSRIVRAQDERSELFTAPVKREPVLIIDVADAEAVSVKPAPMKPATAVLGEAEARTALGITDGETLTLKDLRMRYRTAMLKLNPKADAIEAASAVHVKAAFDTLKRSRGWI